MVMYLMVFLYMFEIICLKLRLLFVVFSTQLLQHHAVKLEELILNIVSGHLKLHHFLHRLTLHCVRLLVHVLVEFHVKLQITHSFLIQVVGLNNLVVIVLIPFLDEALRADVPVALFAVQR